MEMKRQRKTLAGFWEWKPFLEREQRLRKLLG